jgi:hypothetical protein
LVLRRQPVEPRQLNLDGRQWFALLRRGCGDCWASADKFGKLFFICRTEGFVEEIATTASTIILRRADFASGAAGAAPFGTVVGSTGHLLRPAGGLVVSLPRVHCSRDPRR